MTTRHCTSLADLQRQMTADFRARKSRIRKAARRTATDGADYVRHNMPVAFGELRGSTRGESMTANDGARVVTDAPHAEAVENGSRPHWVPLDALIRWVKLRGRQGLARTGKIRQSFKGAPGTTTAAHARSIAFQIKMLEHDGAVAVDAPEQIARAIQIAIARHGTKPHAYMRGALPTVEKLLDAHVRAAMPEVE